MGHDSSPSNSPPLLLDLNSSYVEALGTESSSVKDKSEVVLALLTATV